MIINKKYDINYNNTDTHYSANFFAVITFVLTLYPSLIAYFTLGLRATFQSFAADTFYYLTVAKNSGWSPLFSFDGTNPTNGFHPLHQLILKVSFILLGISKNQLDQILFLYWFSALFVSCAAGIIVHRLISLRFPPLLSLFAVVPGFLFFLFTTVNSNYGSLWSYSNGMESPLSLFLFSCFFWLILGKSIYTDEDIVKPLLISFLLSLMVLARLDDVFLVPAICLPLFWAEKSIQWRIRRAANLVTIPALIISLYCTINYYYAGTFLPISGQAKSGIGLTFNIVTFINSFIPLGELVQKDGFSSWNELTWRALHNIVPMLISMSFLGFFGYKYFSKKQLPDNATNVFFVLAAYVSCKAIYNLLFVILWNQGHWYYPLSIVVTNILILVTLTFNFSFRKCEFSFSFQENYRITRIFFLVLLIISTLFFLSGVFALSEKSHNPIFFSYSIGKLIRILMMLMAPLILITYIFAIYKKCITKIRIPLGIFFTICLILLTANGVISNKLQTSYNKIYQTLWENRHEVSNEILQLDPNAKLLSYDDGIVAYSLDMPVMSGLGFSLDKKADCEKKMGKLLDLAHHRGFNYITSLDYMPKFEAKVGDNVSRYLIDFAALSDEERANWNFYLAYENKKTGLKLLTFNPMEARLGSKILRSKC